MKGSNMSKASCPSVIPCAAGNASPISDGAAALVLASAEAVRAHGLPVLGRLLGYGDAAVDPRDFPVAPAQAIPRALEHAGMEGLEDRAGGSVGRLAPYLH
jgi:acetyl-CoA acetyltransferase